MCHPPETVILPRIHLDWDSLYLDHNQTKLKSIAAFVVVVFAVDVGNHDSVQHVASVVDLDFSFVAVAADSNFAVGLIVTDVVAVDHSCTVVDFAGFVGFD